MKRRQLFLLVLILQIVVIVLIFQQSRINSMSREIKELSMAMVKGQAAIEVELQDIQQEQKELHNRPQMIYGTLARASWYGNWEEGRITASGDIFHKEGYGVAHRSLPFGTVMLFENQESGKIVPGIINDRMPFYSDREFDLSASLAEKLGYLEKGVTELQCYYLFLPVEAIR